jgi:hypothetical protein
VWWAGSKPEDIYVGGRALAVCRGQERLVVRTTGSFEESFSTLAEWCAQRPQGRGKLRVWLSGGLCRPFLAPALEGLDDVNEQQMALEAMAPMQTGLTGPCAVWRDGKKGEASGLRPCAAVSGEVLLRLEEALAAHWKRVISISPWWTALLGRALKEDKTLSLLTVRDCDSLTVLAGSKCSFSLATTIAPVQNDDAAAAALSRLLLTLNTDHGERRQARLRLDPDEVGSEGAPLAALVGWSS